MRLVAIGGGHGTAVSLRALRALGHELTGIVSVADDGGSTGRLRAMLNVAAVGDLRKCLVALADPENPLTASFEHRFAMGELAGHAVGNLLLVGLIDATGSLEESVAALAQVMGVKGTILPASCEGVELVAATEEGPARGQSLVSASRAIRRVGLEPANPAAPIGAVEAIERADVVVIGPGSLYTSVLAACIVPGITQALAGTRARKVLVANLRAEEAETEGMGLDEHLSALSAHGVWVDEVIVERTSAFAEDALEVPRVLGDVAATSGLVHDVQKLSLVLEGILEQKGRGS